MICNIYQSYNDIFFFSVSVNKNTQTVKSLIFVASQRGGPKLIVSGYSFERNKGNYRSTYWRCSMMRSKKCKAKVVTNSSNSRICMTYSLHNHAPDYSQFIENDEATAASTKALAPIIEHV